VIITGGCLCRAVRYRAAGAPLVTRVCWCRLCQYLAAGNGTVNVCFRKAELTVEGELRGYRSIAHSGNVMHRRFCPVCGTQLFSESEQGPHLIFVRAGSLDDRELAQPSATIWTSQAPTWACIDDRLPTTPEQLPPMT
jgi:hypothetical protein